MARISLKDDNSRFAFRAGDKVIGTDADGYADADLAGVVVDGVWVGDLGGGAYDTTYRIERKRGRYFDAKEIALRKRFDTDDELRGEIGEKLRTRQIPGHVPRAEGEQCEGHELTRAAAAGEFCDVCGHRIRLSDTGRMEYEYPTIRQVVRFDGRCNTLWLREIRARRLGAR